MNIYQVLKENTGKMSMAVLVLLGISVFMLLFVFDVQNKGPQDVSAAAAGTAVTVLNTAPLWTVDAEESPESSVTNESNVGATQSWVGTATDSNANPYYLVICKTGVIPTANTNNPPTCNGGAGNMWAVSGSTTSGNQATASVTVLTAWAESNDWYAWICDSNGASPKCNATYKQGTANTASPFIVNHRPIFETISNNSSGSTVPGTNLVWTASISDYDTLGGNDTFKLHVCRSNDFTGTSCGVGGWYASSSFITSSTNASASYNIVIPTQDRSFNAYVYAIDDNALQASGGVHTTNNAFTVANAAPTISTSSIVINNGTDLILSVAGAQTTGFNIKFTVTDNNSCAAYPSGNEITSASMNLFRSGIGSANCRTAGQYDANNCYPKAVGSSTWNVVCTQDGGTCSGAGDPYANWTCTFPLWYHADPTDGTVASDTVYYNQIWSATASASDNNWGNSAFYEADVLNREELTSFTYMNLNTATISYGELEPGMFNDPLDKVASISSWGNTGLDERLYGSQMCTTYPTCSGLPTDTIGIDKQKYASPAFTTFANGASLSANPGVVFALDVTKTTVTASPEWKPTYWGIKVPSAITLSGDYTGVNTIIGVKSDATKWGP